MIRGGALGDFVVTVPAIRALRQKFPEARVTFIGNAAAASSLAPELFDTIVAFDDPAVLPIFGGMPGRPCRVAEVDLVVLCMNDPDGDIRAALSRLGAGEILHVPPIPGESDCHITDHLLRSIQPLVQCLSHEFHRQAWLKSDVASETDSRTTGAVIVHPGSGSLTKNWPYKRFAEAIDALANQGIGHVVLLKGPADHDCVDLVAEVTISQVSIWQPAMLSDLATCLSRARLYLGNDSGVSHVAGAVGAPSIVIFGPTDPRRWAPRGPRVSIVAPQSPGSMAEVGPTTTAVLSASRKLLGL